MFWKEPIGWPNASRSLTYASVQSSAARAAATPATAIDSRSCARLCDQLAEALRPPRRAGSRPGRATSLKNSSAVSCACRPIFSRLRPRSKPCMPRSTTSRLMPRVALRRVGLHGGDDEVGVDAVRDERLRAVDDVARRRRGSPWSSSTARSEPVPGSVIAIAVISSPEADAGQPALPLLVVAVARGSTAGRCRCAASARGRSRVRPARLHLLADHDVEAEVVDAGRRRTPRARPCRGSRARRQRRTARAGRCPSRSHCSWCGRDLLVEEAAEALAEVLVLVGSNSVRRIGRDRRRRVVPCGSRSSRAAGSCSPRSARGSSRARDR